MDCSAFSGKAPDGKSTIIVKVIVMRGDPVFVVGDDVKAVGAGRARIEMYRQDAESRGLPQTSLLCW